MASERLWTRDFICITAINFLLYMIYYQLMLWSTVYAQAAWHVSLSEAGLASGIFIIGALISRVITGRFVDITGRKRILFAGAVIYFAALPFYFIGSSLSTFMIVRCVHGVAYGISATAASTVVGALVPAARRGEGIGYYALGNTVASALGPFLGIVLSRGGNYFFNLYECLFLSAVIVFLTLSLHTPEHVTTETEREALHHLSARSFILEKALPISCISFFCGVVYSAVLSFMGSYADSLGLITGGTLFFFAYALSSFLSRPVTGRILDRSGGNIVMYPTLIFLGLCMLFVAFASSSLYFIIGGLLLGLSFSTMTSAGQALAIHGVPDAQIGLATSTFFALTDLGIGIGPYPLGLTVSLWGFSGVYFVAAAIAFLSIPLYYVLITKNHMFTPRWMRIMQHRKELTDKHREK